VTFKTGEHSKLYTKVASLLFNFHLKINKTIRRCLRDISSHIRTKLKIRGAHFAQQPWFLAWVIWQQFAHARTLFLPIQLFLHVKK